MADQNPYHTMMMMLKQMMEMSQGSPSSASTPAPTINPSPIATSTLIAMATATPENPPSPTLNLPSPSSKSDVETSIPDLEVLPHTEVLNPMPLQMHVLGDASNPIDPDSSSHLHSLSKTAKSTSPIRKSKRLHSDVSENPEVASSKKARKEKSKAASHSLRDESASSGEQSLSPPADDVTKDVTPTAAPLDEDDDSDTDSPLDVSQAFNKIFYSKEAKKSHALFVKRTLKVEKMIDVLSFKKYEMDMFLKKEFSPNVINTFLELGNEDTIMSLDLIHDVVEVITRGVQSWMNKVAASKLTFFYTVLFKLTVYNYLPTSNASVLTIDQALLLYKMGTHLPFNLGAYIFDAVMKETSKSSPSNVLPFPCLIFVVLKSQRLKESKKKLVIELPSLSIQKPKGNDDRIIDLPYHPTAARQETQSANVTSAPSQCTACPDVEPVVASMPSIPIIMMPLETLQHQIDQLDQTITHLTAMRDVFITLISSQKGGVSNDGNERDGTSHAADVTVKGKRRKTAAKGKRKIL
ncbi:hypothetical protein C2S51_037172 [Perilla frutescens var. frutescens]|nr:hypothetical protein C2S51_037172 [Perilla frutescens var. frutescens]